VFGVAFSVILYGKKLSMRIILEFLTIFMAVIISETKLAFLKRIIVNKKYTADA